MGIYTYIYIYCTYKVSQYKVRVTRLAWSPLLCTRTQNSHIWHLTLLIFVPFQSWSISLSSWSIHFLWSYVVFGLIINMSVNHGTFTCAWFISAALFSRLFQHTMSIFHFLPYFFSGFHCLLFPYLPTNTQRCQTLPHLLLAQHHRAWQVSYFHKCSPPSVELYLLSKRVLIDKLSLNPNKTNT